jgi:KUP system potassium uptake protein
MTRQAIQLGFLPRMNVVHTSEREIGQVYVPAINWMLLAAVVLSVLGFGSSTALGSAYGIAVTGTMLITTVLTFYVVRYAWHYNWLLCVLSTGFFFAIDAAFFSANLLKFLQGGWYPLLAGAVIFTVMTTWHRGREMMIEQARTRAGAVPLRQYLDRLFGNPPLRVGGTAVFPTINPDAVPHALINNIEHNGVFHDRVIFANVTIRDVPYVAANERLTITSLGRNCFRIVIAYGFKDVIDLPAALRDCAAKGLLVDTLKVSYFLSHALVVATGGKGMSMWRERMFAAMSHNIGNVAEYLKLPANRVMELGSRVEI